MNFTFICSNIPVAPAYEVYISQLIRYSRACDSYQDFLDRCLLLTRKLLNQGFLLVKLKSSLRKFYSRHHDLVDRYGIFVSQMTTDMFHMPVLSSFMTYHQVCKWINTTDATSGAGTGSILLSHCIWNVAWKEGWPLVGVVLLSFPNIWAFNNWRGRIQQESLGFCLLHQFQ